MSNLPEALFNMSRFLLHAIMKYIPHGISKVYPFLMTIVYSERFILKV